MSCAEGPSACWCSGQSAESRFPGEPEPAAESQKDPQIPSADCKSRDDTKRIEAHSRPPFSFQLSGSEKSRESKVEERAEEERESGASL